MSNHAMDEMAEDDLDILDVEEAVLNGQITRVEKDDPRGTKYVVHGLAADGMRPVGVVGRITSGGRYLIIGSPALSVIREGKRPGQSQS